MGNGALGHIEQCGDIAHAHLADKQTVKNADTGRIAKYFEKLAQIKQNFFGRHMPVYIIDGFIVYMQVITGFRLE
jgi:hypothetical protein